MPTYDYACKACGKTMEIFHSITDAPKRKCPLCKKSALERKIGAGAGILFKGTGFYQTDYRSDAYQKAAKADSGASSTSDSSTKSESKSGDAAASDAKSGESKAKTESTPAPKKSNANSDGSAPKKSGSKKSS